ncbi:uncharacterized protein LOC122525667 [Polistes fuscatus]|uniref:uncharacterized protein LOC122525667 n=1 Tax=Polistes fuscatus TaxID=30207 RepID=UPI001CA8D270|nr:uncharacterized protein LOC122525667 [Polistes fuscatus]
MIPVMNTKGSAPENLLKMVQCACTGDCKSLRCSCRKSGLLCTQFCKYCGGQSCSNFSTSTVENSAEIRVEERDEDVEDMARNEFLDIVEGLDFEDSDFDQYDENEQEDYEEIEYPFKAI